jgi:2-hydroxy-3-keto-5-methylthiopentenyl-1-phosphate phosphatase
MKIDNIIKYRRGWIKENNFNFKFIEKHLNIYMKLIFEYNKEQDKIYQLNYYFQINLL